MTGPADEIVGAVSAGGGIAVRTITGTGLVSEAAERHGLSPVARVALGRALMGAALLATGGKDDETLQLNFSGDGPLRGVTAIADASGRVRGYVGDPSVDVGSLDVAAAVGRGQLSVVRSRPRWKSPYTGVVPLVTGTVAQDLAHYLERSEQTRSAVALGVFLAEDGAVSAAAGYFVSVLPGAAAEEIDQVEANVRGFPGPGELVRAGQDGAGILEHLLAGLGSGPFSRSRPAFACPCERSRALRTLSLLPDEEIAQAAAEREILEVRCEFCGERYAIAGDEIAALLGGGPP